MEFKLMDFKLQDVDGMAHVRYVIETVDGSFEYDEMLIFENKEDIDILNSMEAFINIKSSMEVS